MRTQRDGKEIYLETNLFRLMLKKKMIHLQCQARCEMENTSVYFLHSKPAVQSHSDGVSHSIL